MTNLSQFQRVSRGAISGKKLDLMVKKLDQLSGKQKELNPGAIPGLVN